MRRGVGALSIQPELDEQTRHQYSCAGQTTPISGEVVRPIQGQSQILEAYSTLIVCAQ